MDVKFHQSIRPVANFLLPYEKDGGKQNRGRSLLKHTTIELLTGNGKSNSNFSKCEIAKRLKKDPSIELSAHPFLGSCRRPGSPCGPCPPDSCHFLVHRQPWLEHF
jgi:hypothetical protein